MVIPSRWTTEVPRCSLQQWIFGSATGPLSDKKIFLDADRPETHFLTMAEYRLLSKRVALGLIDAGLKPGQRVLMYSGNSIYFPPVFLGVLMAGGIFTGANPSFVCRELAYQLRNSEAVFMISAASSLPTALEAAKEVGMPRENVFIFDTPTNPKSDRPSPGRAGRKDGARHWTELLQGNLSRAEGWAWAEPADSSTTTCCLNYSSGTTGVPKGVEISHYAYVANGEGVTTLDKVDPDLEAKRARARGLGFLPLYHAFGQTYFIANYPHSGLPIYMMPGFDFQKMLQHVERFRITNLTCVPPIVVALAKHPLARKHDLSSVEAIGCGAAPLGQEVADEVEKLWPSGRLQVRQGWGMTEVTCTSMSWDPTATQKSSGVGELMPNCAARLMELDGKTEIKEANRRGELWVTGPNLLRGYWRNPQATAETVVTDEQGTRWLKTGDIAYVETYGPGAIFHIVDRIKELIKVKGNQVAPAELEAVLLEHPDVSDVAVVGVTIQGEELPRAYIVRSEGCKAKEQDIAAWMAGKVIRYKQLKGGVAFIDAIPKNPVSERAIPVSS